MMLSRYSLRDHLNGGWMVAGKVLLPPNAFTDEFYFLCEFKKHFPEKRSAILKRISGNKLHREIYTQMATFKIIEFLNSKYEKIL
jgi:hypothetical protein